MTNRSITLTLRANASGLTQGLRQAQRESEATSRSFRNLSADTRDALNDAGGKLMIGGGVLAAGFGVAVKKFADFDKAMSSVSAATHASEADMKSLRDAAVKAGADTAFSAVEAAQAIEELAKAGVSTQDIMGGGLDGALSLAAAGSLDVGKAAEIASSALTQFELKGSDVSHVADLLAAGAGKAQGGVEDLGMAMDQSGLVAAQTGLSIEETVGGLTAFANAGLVGSDAGTSFKTMLQSLTPSSKESAKLMDELGITAYDAQGNFVGLSQFAGNLQNGLKDLSVEQQNAAMKTIFGSDAVRAASVLYKEGAQGVQKWIDAVDDSGYAAETAARMQDNLAGDLEKLGGSLDTVFLKSGSGANGFLRGLVQGTEDLVDAIGNIPEGVLSTGAMIAGLGGGSLLAVGGFMRLTTSVSDTIGAWRNLQSSAPRAATALSRVGKAAGIAGAAIAAIEFSKMVNNSTEPAAKSAESYAQALTGIGNASDDVAKSNFQKLFVKEMPTVGQSMGKMINPIIQTSTIMDDMSGSVNNLGDALNRINPDNPMKHLASFGSTVAGFRNDTTVATETLKGLDDALASMATAGDYSQMKDSLAMMIKSAEEGGRSFENLKPQLGGLFDALSAKATELKVSLNPDEIWAWAQTGEVPARIQQATDALSKADAAAKGLSQSTAEIKPPPSLQELVDGVTKLGNAFLSARDASRGYEEAVDAAQAALKENGKTLDITTEKGRANQAALDGIGSSALAAAESASGMTAKMQTLGAGRDEVIRLGQAMGMSKGEAASLADSMGLIPSKIYTEFSGNPGDMLGQLQGIKAAMDAVPKGKSITIRESNPEVIDAIKRLGYKVETLPNGQIKVTQTGAKVAQAKIEAVARKRYNATLTASVANAGYAESVLNSIARGRNATITVNTVQRGQAGTVTYGKSDGHGRPTMATGGRLLGARKSLSGYAGGGKLPRTGLGTDQILGVSPTTGRPTAWVDDSEWVINKKSSQKYNGLLSAINQDSPAVQGLAALASGGRVSWSSKDQGKSKAALSKAKAEARAAEKAEKAAQKTYDKIDAKKANKGAKSSAKSKLSAAKKRSDKADKALERAEKAYTDDRERTSRLRELEFDTRRDLYRGDIRDNYGAGNYSGVDALFEQSNNKDLSGKSRGMLRAVAYQQEKQVKALTTKQAGLEKRLDTAQSKFDELAGVRDGVKSQMAGAFDLGSLRGQKDAWGYDKPVSKSSLMGFGKKLAAGARALSLRVKELQKRGFPPAMIEQVIGEWSSDQTFELADAMLAMNKAERGTFTGYFKSVESYGAKTGTYLTESMFKGGVDAARGVVKGLESQLGSVERAFANLGKQGERAYRKSLGINSPSRVLKAAGAWAGKGAALGVRDSIPENEQAMLDLAQAQAAAYQPQYRLPASAEVQAHAVSQGGSAYTLDIDYDRLAAAMSRTQVVAQISRSAAADVVREGNKQAGLRR